MLHRQERNPNALLLSGNLYLEPDFLKPGETATLRVAFYLTLFGNHREKTIPFQTAAVNSLDGLRCFDGDFHEIVCNAPFRWPGHIISAKPPAGGRTVFTSLISYSPFPANLQLSPIVSRTAGPFWSHDEHPSREVTIESEEPLAYVRRVVEVPDVSLGAR